MVVSWGLTNKMVVLMGSTLWLFNIAMENHHAINGKTHYKLPFSIAMLNYQRVSGMIWLRMVTEFMMVDD
jgi:hypothetical protein